MDKEFVLRYIIKPGVFVYLINFDIIDHWLLTTGDIENCSVKIYCTRDEALNDQCKIKEYFDLDFEILSLDEAEKEDVFLYVCTRV